MDISFLNLVEPTLVGVNSVNKLNCPLAGSRFGPRVVKHYELDLITWGEGYVITEGKKIPANKGTLFFRKPGMVVEGITPYYCYFIVLEMFNNDVNRNISLSHIPDVIVFENISYIEELFFKLYNEFISPSAISQFITKTYLMEILHYVFTQWESKYRFNSSSRSLRANYQKIISVKEHIENNIQLQFTLNELADMVSLSRYHFCRIFNEIVGETPISYINKCKINYAKRQLIETDKSVKEIMLDSGFENESYFFRLFKKYTGISPSDYSKKYKYL
ncbi:AraC family transcriptional regulator [Clostridium estertheticum]|uniref:AraC family transcriptional regulator n=1 Tax=Clostridium estertheticum TaxID=238834 RepID=UPI0013E8FE8B|nr:AraC family transcriptional regulator [Clostridium estertheticum]MBZ9686010.1 AraC family transcriptional regulator [Clostridium estertheticum]